MVKEANKYAMSRNHVEKYLASQGIRFVRKPHESKQPCGKDGAHGKAPAKDADTNPAPIPPQVEAIDEGWLTMDEHGNGSATLVDEDLGEAPKAPATGVCDAGHDLLATLDDLSGHIECVACDIKALRAIIASKEA